MAISGTTTFTVTRDDIIQAAMRKLSVLEEGATPTATSVTNFAFSLNLILKSWQKDGIKLWTISDLTIPLTANKTTYSIGPTGTSSDIVSDKPLKVLQGRIRNISVSPNIDIPMLPLSRQEYNELGSKFSTGQINSYFYNPLTTTGTLTLFLTPDATISSNYQFIATVQRPIMDVNTATDNFDLPAEWFYPLMWALVSDQASDNDKTLQERVYYDQKAKELREDVSGWDVENTSTRFVLDMRMNGFK